MLGGLAGAGLGTGSSTRVEGIVTEWSTRGFGFIQFIDGRRAYAHHTQIGGGGHLEQGEAVSALVAEDNHNTGKWAAMDIQRGALPLMAQEPAQGVALAEAPAGELQEPSRQDGVVAEWNDRGYGFILFNDGRRAYVHHSSITSAGPGPVDLKRGELINAMLVEDAQNPGKWAALDVQRKSTMMPQARALATAQHQLAPLFSQMSGSMAPDVERVEGVVIEWNPRGFGFILIPDGRRAYVHHSQTVGGNLQEGEPVNCAIAEDSRNPGKWAATDVRRGPLPAVAPQAHLQQAPLQAMLASQLVQTQEDRAECVVTEWNERGYGFLQAADGRRAYVHASAFGGGDLVPGETVNVNIVEDPQKPGKWQARALQRGPLGGDGQAYMNQGVRGGGDAPQMGQRLRMQPKPAAVPEPEPTQELAPMAATVMEWDLRGYGFVHLDDGRRVYVHHSAFGTGNLAVGERVSIAVCPDQRNPGKLMAQALARDAGLAAQAAQGVTELQSEFQGELQGELQGGFQGGFQARSQGADFQGELSAAPFALPAGLVAEGVAPQEDWQRGTVMEWHEERGYGFILLEDNRRLYVHHSAFGGGSLLQGMQCEAVPTPDRVNAGKWGTASVRGDAVMPRAPGEPGPKRQRMG